MTDYELDRLTRRVMLDAARQEYGDLMEELPEHMFTPAFERKMKRLVRRGNHPLRYQVIHAAACLLLVLLLSGCSILAFSAEAREIFVGWVREVYETAFLYRFIGQEQEQKDIHYAPTWLPAGYHQISMSKQGAVVDIVYQDAEGQNAVFCYMTDPKASTLTIDKEYVEEQEVQVKGHAATLYVDRREDKANILVWTDDETNILFMINAHATGEELIKMAESVEAVEEQPPLEEHQLTWVPAGYQEYERVRFENNKNQSYILYQNADGDIITLGYCLSSEALSLHVVPTGGDELDPQPVFVGGFRADLYLQENEASALVWEDEGLLFYIMAQCSAEELIAMAESVEVIPPEYRPAWLPKGYELYEKFGGSFADDHATFIYENSSGEMLTYICSQDHEGRKLVLAPNENSVEKQVFVGDNPADLYLATIEGLSSELLWWDPEMKAFLYISAALPEEDILKVAESVQELPPVPAAHCPAWLPMGYHFTGGSSTLIGMERRYKNEAGDEIQFTFSRSNIEDERQELQEEVKNLEEQNVFINGQEAKLYITTEGIHYLLWSGEKSEELYWLTSSLDSEVMIQIAESVQLSYLK